MCLAQGVLLNLRLVWGMCSLSQSSKHFIAIIHSLNNPIPAVIQICPSKAKLDDRSNDSYGFM